MYLKVSRPMHLVMSKIQLTGAPSMTYPLKFYIETTHSATVVRSVKIFAFLCKNEH